MKKTSILPFLLVGFVFLTILPERSLAWFNNPKINSVIAPKTTNQLDQTAISDGAGGAIITWSEQVNGSNVEFDIYAQKIDSHGDLVWSEPVAICTAPGYQGVPKIVSDGIGGAIIVWHDLRAGNGSVNDLDLYAQRINRDGKILWPVDGVSIVTAPQRQKNPKVAPDGMGGAIMAWDDDHQGYPRIYAQRVSQKGQIMWPKDGVAVVSNDTYAQADPDIVSDGSGGAIIVWTDFRPVNISNIYAQKLDSNGTRLWSKDGLAVCTVVGNQFNAKVASDGIGGGIFSWTDGRSGDENLDIYAQRIASNGAPLWALQGIPITQAAGNQLNSVIISDGTGGAIIAWEDARKGTEDTDIYAQRITANGELLWNAGGQAVAASDEFQIHPVLLADGGGGAFIAWQDFYRQGTWWNIFAQYIDGSGKPQWKQDGIPVSIADEAQVNPVIIQDGSGGMVIVWQDSRSGTYNNIYAQQVDRRGLLGGGEFKFHTADQYGFPQISFITGEMILFDATWTMPAPSTPGTYQAGSGMVIHSNTLYQEEFCTYTVK